jgi:hypothetical protein
MRPPARLVDATITVYPEAVRDRYGPEIAGLLQDSPRPWRDLGDVAWNAALERAGTMSAGRLRPHGHQMLALVTFPGVFFVAMIVLLPATSIIAAALGALAGPGHIGFSGDNGIDMDAGYGTFAVSTALNIAFVALIASLNARRWIDSLAVPALAFLVPTLLALGCLGTAVLPPGFVLMYEAPMMLPSGVACWWLMVVVAGTQFSVLRRRGRTAAARTLAVAGTPTVLVVTFAVLVATGPLDKQWQFVHLWPMGPFALMAVCTPFTFAILAASPHRPMI